MRIKQRQRELFFALLTENREYLGLSSRSKYYLICKKLAKRDFKRFMAVDERDREDLFQDFIDELFEEEREAETQRSKQVVESIKDRLEEREDIGLDTRWREVNDLLHSDPLWKNAQPLERLTAFEEYIKEKDKADFLRKKANRQRAERKRREVFKEFI